MFQSLLRLCLALILLCIQAGHAETLEIPNAPSPRSAIDVSRQQLNATAEINVLNETIPSDELIGALGAGYSCRILKGIAYDPSKPAFSLPIIQQAFAEIAHKAGYRSYDRNISVFEDRFASAPDFSIAITVKDLKYKACLTTAVIDDHYALAGHAYIEAQWELHYAKTQQVVYSKTVKAHFVVDEDTPVRCEDFVPGVMSQLINEILGDPDYVAAYAHPETVNQEVPKDKKNLDTTGS